MRSHDNGLQCEKCETWFHIKCENVSLDFYKALRKASEEIWFCTACKGKVKSLIETVKELEQKNDLLQRKMECLEDKWDNLKDSMVRETMHMVMDNLKTEMSVNTMGGMTKKEIVEDVKDELLKAMKEEEERKQRATNLVLYNVSESEKQTGQEKEQDDLEFCESIIKDGVGMEIPLDIQEVVRLGKHTNAQQLVKPRPILVKFKDSRVKWQILKNAKNLKRTDIEEFKNVFIAPDLTREQREWDKKLREELKSRKDAGEEGWYIKRGVLCRKCFL